MLKNSPRFLSAGTTTGKASAVASWEALGGGYVFNAAFSDYPIGLNVAFPEDESGGVPGLADTVTYEPVSKV